MLECYFKRAKIFLLNDENGERRYTASVNANGTTTRNVPDWVRDTPTFKMGLKDLSIINLTPAEPVIEETPALVEEEEEEEPEPVIEETPAPVEEEEEPVLVPAGIDPAQPTANGTVVRPKKTAVAKRA
jgi:hypothetical protein